MAYITDTLPEVVTSLRQGGKSPAQGQYVTDDGHVSRSPDADSRDPDLSAAVRAAQEGDEDAFRLLYRAIHPGLIRYLWAQVGDAAEDVAAETWLRVARDLKRFKGDGAGFRGWVTSIGRHRVLDYLRYQGRHPQGGAPVELLAHLPAAEDTERAVMDALATASALEMITGLPPTQAEAVLLTVVMQLDAKTAGKVMGKRSGAVRVAAHRGLRRLAERLAVAESRAAESGTAETGTAGFSAAEPDAASETGVTEAGGGASGTDASDTDASDTGPSDTGASGAGAGESGAAGTGKANASITRATAPQRHRNVPHQRVTTWQATTVKDVR
jgi:RNA polymerase sigma-70 factor (ECF subfamily)